MQRASFHGHSPLWQLAPRWTHLIGDLVRALSPDRPACGAVGLGGIIPLIFGWQRYSNSEAGGDCNLNGPKKRRQNGRPPSLPFPSSNSIMSRSYGGIPRSGPLAVADDVAAAPFSVRASEAYCCRRRLIKGSVMRTRKKIHSKIDQLRYPYQQPLRMVSINDRKIQFLIRSHVRQSRHDM